MGSMGCFNGTSDKAMYDAKVDDLKSSSFEC